MPRPAQLCSQSYSQTVYFCITAFIHLSVHLLHLSATNQICSFLLIWSWWEDLIVGFLPSLSKCSVSLMQLCQSSTSNKSMKVLYYARTPTLYSKREVYWESVSDFVYCGLIWSDSRQWIPAGKHHMNHWHQNHIIRVENVNCAANMTKSCYFISCTLNRHKLYILFLLYTVDVTPSNK